MFKKDFGKAYELRRVLWNNINETEKLVIEAQKETNKEHEDVGVIVDSDELAGETEGPDSKKVKT